MEQGRLKHLNGLSILDLLTSELKRSKKSELRLKSYDVRYVLFQEFCFLLLARKVARTRGVLGPLSFLDLALFKLWGIDMRCSFHITSCWTSNTTYYLTLVGKEELFRLFLHAT